MQNTNIHIIGTSHIAKQSLQEIRHAFESFDPDIVAIELDKRRLMALLSEKKEGRINIFRTGIRAYVFIKIGEWAQKKLGKLAGVEPGSDMLLGYKLAIARKKRVALIDQRFEKTIKRVTSSFSWKEGGNLLADIIRALVFRKAVIEFELDAVPGRDIVKNLLKKLKGRYPNLYNALISERDRVMACNIAMIMGKYPGARLLAIIGAGHEEGVKKHLDKLLDKDVTYSYSVDIG